MIHNWKGFGLLLSNTVYRAGGEKKEKKEIISNPEKVCSAETCQAVEIRFIFSRDNN